MGTIEIECPHCGRKSLFLESIAKSEPLICGRCFQSFLLSIQNGIACTTRVFKKEDKGTLSQEQVSFVEEYKEAQETYAQGNGAFGQGLFVGLLLGGICLLIMLYGLQRLFSDANIEGGLGALFFCWLFGFGAFSTISEGFKHRERFTASKRFVKDNKKDFLALEDSYSEYERERTIKEIREAEEAAARKREEEDAKRKRHLENLRLREFWKKLSGLAFEREVGNLFRGKGATAAVTKASGDQGIDLVINDVVIAQCKNHKKPIGRPDFQRLYGELMHCNGKYKKALMITTSGATQEARLWIIGKPMAVLDLEGIIGIAEGRIDFQKFLL